MKVISKTPQQNRASQHMCLESFHLSCWTSLAYSWTAYLNTCLPDRERWAASLGLTSHRSMNELSSPLLLPSHDPPMHPPSLLHEHCTPVFLWQPHIPTAPACCPGDTLRCDTDRWGERERNRRHELLRICNLNTCRRDEWKTEEKTWTVYIAMFCLLHQE